MGPCFRRDDASYEANEARKLPPSPFHRFRQTRLRRSRPQRLLLALMRRPAGQPDHVEGGADAAVGIGKALGVKLRHPQQRGAAGWRPPPLDQNIGRGHPPEILHQCEGGVSPRVAPFADLRDVGALLQRAGFALPVTDVDRVVVRYDSAFALMQDLRNMGATNVLVERRRTPTRRATMLRMAQLYAERLSDPDGRIRATFDVIWLSGWAPHESQQQPLQPGSAKASLADAVRKRK